jgi:cytoskeleton protein RodZ
VNTETQSELIPTAPGDVLRHERQKKGVSLEQAARDSRIRLEHLDAIESGETQQIPQVYLNGYIRNYARYLGMRAGEIDKHLPNARGSEPAVQSVFSSSLPRNPDDRWFKATSYVLASVVVIALVWQFTTEAVRFSQGDPIVRTGGPDSSGNNPVDPGSASENARSAQQAAGAKSHLQASIASLDDVQRGRREIGGSGAEGAWSAIGKSAPDDELSVTLIEGEQSLQISTSADSWVEITDGNGQQVEMDLLRAGNKRSYVAVAPVRLLLGRASSIELTHNGATVDLSPYTRGNVARITLSDPLEEQSPQTDQPQPDQPQTEQPVPNPADSPADTEVQG